MLRYHTAIVKLRMRYEGQTADDERWGNGTSWLVRPDILVTAGHNIYNWGRGLGRVVAIKACIGKTPANRGSGVQFRRGKCVATTTSWLESDKNRMNNAAFVQVEHAFTEVTPFTYETIPNKGSERLGVVGYSGDKKHDGEKAAHMYEMFANVNYDLSASKENMLEYRISTFAGT